MLPAPFLFLAILLLQFMLGQALPTTQSSNHTKILQQRQCEWDAEKEEFVCDDKLPTVQQIVDRMHNKDELGTVDDAHSAVFYTGLGPEFGDKETEWILGWLKKVGLKYYWLYTAVDVLNSEWYQAQLEFILENEGKPEYKEKWGGDALHDFSACWFQALAVAAVNPDAYVFVPKGAKFKGESMWSKIELPYLTQNPKIKRIYRVDPRPPDQGGESCGSLDDRELYWDREKGDEPITPAWKCPAS